MDLLSEYKDLYYKTIDHSERLNNKINSSITQLAVIGSGNIIIWQKYFTTSIDTIYLILCFISLITFMFSLIFFYRAYSGYTYAYFPIKDMSLKIQQTISLTKDMEDGITKSENHINGMLMRTYLKCAIFNTNTNIKKTTRHKMFTTIFVIAFISLAVAFSYNIAIIENIHLK